MFKRQEWQKRYWASPKGKRTRKKYQQSLKGKANSKRYNQSIKGRQTRRNALLKNKYGITLKEYQRLNRKQNKRCAICKRVRVLHVDHCHKTEKVRSLLCCSCNWMLGNAEDNIKILKQAINYLRKYE